MLSHFQVLCFTEPAIDRYARLKVMKVRIKHMDLRIAAIALESGGTLVIRNVSDFRTIRELPIVDWSA